MKYLFDCSFIKPQGRYKSIPLYAARLIRALPEEVSEDCTVIIDSEMETYFKSLNPRLKYVSINYHTFISRLPKYGEKFNSFLYKRTISRIAYDCVLIMDEQRDENLFVTTNRKVAVFHDLKGVKSSNRRDANFDYYQKLINSCDSLIAISKYTKSDIIKYFNVPEENIHVVYNSVELTNNAAKPHGFDQQKNYILYVNTLQPYKNVITLIKAFDEIKDIFDLNLVVVGKTTEYWNEIQSTLIDNKLERRVLRLENLKEEELVFLYKNAKLFVTTSLHEGFGYTPIEAAICKCPVISSKCEALPDTTQNLLYYYGPAEDYISLKNKIIEVLSNPPSEDKLTSISDYFKAQYTTQKQAAEILRIMNNNII